MSFNTSTSPRKKAPSGFSIYEDSRAVSGLGDGQVSSIAGLVQTELTGQDLQRSASALGDMPIPLPLTTSKLVNQLTSPKVAKPSLVTALQPTDNLQKAKLESPMEELLAKLSEQQGVLSRQKLELENETSLSSSSESRAETPPTERDSADNRPDPAEVLKLKQALELAQHRMAQMDLELTQSRITKHTMEQAIGSPFEPARDLSSYYDAPSARIGPHSHPFENGPQPAVRVNSSMGGYANMTSSAGNSIFDRPSSSFGMRPQFQVPQYQKAPTPPQFPFMMPGPMQPPQYLPAPIGTRLSPTASEFSVEPASYGNNLPWNVSVSDLH